MSHACHVQPLLAAWLWTTTGAPWRCATRRAVRCCGGTWTRRWRLWDGPSRRCACLQRPPRHLQAVHCGCAGGATRQAFSVFRPCLAVSDSLNWLQHFEAINEGCRHAAGEACCAPDHTVHASQVLAEGSGYEEVQLSLQCQKFIEIVRSVTALCSFALCVPCRAGGWSQW